MHRWRLQNGFIIPLSIVVATAMIVSFYPDYCFATADYLSDNEEYEEKKSESASDDSYEAYADSVANITGIPWISPYFYDPAWEISISESLDTLFYYPQNDTARTYIIPSTIKVIDDRAFQCNHHLEGIVVPDGVKEIGIRAFHASSELRTAVIKGPVESLRWMSFDSCDKLESVDLPEKLSYLDGFVFANCGNLRKVTIRNPVPPIIDFIGDEDDSDDMDPEWAFSGVPLEECLLYVPKGTVPLYKKANGWKLFGKIVEL